VQGLVTYRRACPTASSSRQSSTAHGTKTLHYHRHHSGATKSLVLRENIGHSQFAKNLGGSNYELRGSTLDVVNDDMDKFGWKVVSMQRSDMVSSPTPTVRLAAARARARECRSCGTRGHWARSTNDIANLKLKCIFAKLRGVLGKKSVLEIAHNLVMAELSDISPVVENLQIIFFYVIGTISLVVECTTLFIIVTKGCALTPEFRYLTIFQQIACMFSTSFMTLLYIPFFYPRLGIFFLFASVYANIPFTRPIILTIKVIQVFLTATKFAAFGMMIIARHQMLLMDSSYLKVRPLVKYVWGPYYVQTWTPPKSCNSGMFVAILCMLQGVTVCSVFSAIVSDRAKQIYSLRWVSKLDSFRNKNLSNFLQHPQIKWNDRGLNWFLFDDQLDIAFYSNISIIPALFVLIVLPFSHMFRIVSQAQKRIESISHNKVMHIQQARTIIIQCFVLLGFFLFPFIAPALSTMRNNVYAHTQTLIVISEMVFVCSTLCNSIVIVARNRVYRAAVMEMAGQMPFLIRKQTSRADLQTDSSTRA
ncbi:hypothetical protein PRIPAC_77823, partial [Pristionchus pacificus]|uniref:G protein-coupled receptor n=1 Tax=Pristionchus pacificus TaxID=54126 RepID=A0A2A6BVJ1_PRIPA